MAHETLFSHNNNGFVRQLRSFLLDAPRVNRGNDHDDIANLGVDYELAAAAGARPAGDILHIAPEVACPRTTHRATCVVASAVGGSYGTNVNESVTFTSGVSGTILSDDGDDWSATHGFVAGDLIRIRNSTSNDGVWRIATITTSVSTNDLITLNAADNLPGSENETCDLVPITGGSVLEVVEDFGGGATHLGWLMDDIEFMAKDGTLWLYLRSGGSWAVGDYAEFTLERGAFSLHENLAVVREVVFDDTGGDDEITRNDYEGSFIADGFVAAGLVEVSGSVSNDGTYLIDSVTAGTIVLDTAETLTDETLVEVTLTPRQRFTVTFDDANASFSSKPTIFASAVEWETEGYFAGMLIEVADAVDGANNTLLEIESVDTTTTTNDTLVLVDAVVDEVADVITATPRFSILHKWTEHRYIWGSGSGVGAPSNANDLTGGALPPIPNTDGNYSSEWVAIAPGNDPINSPQTIYAGWQSFYNSASVQNVEMRVFDAVSDSSFGSLGNASPPTYMFLTLDPSMETYMTADGEFTSGLLDVNTSVGEWFYQGFGNVHGTHPRPLINGGIGNVSTGSRVGTGDSYRFFPNGIDGTSGLSDDFPKTRSTCWHRWVDGQWFAVASYHQRTGSQVFVASDVNTQMFPWPYLNTTLTPAINFPYNGGLDEAQPLKGDSTDIPILNFTFFQGLRPTPTTITPNPNREFPLWPITFFSVVPDLNVVVDLKGVFFIPGTGQATKNRILQDGKTYIVGQNHEKTGQWDFAALLLD